MVNVDKWKEKVNKNSLRKNGMKMSGLTRDIKRFKLKQGW